MALLISATLTLLPGALFHEYLFQRALFIALGSPTLNTSSSSSSGSSWPPSLPFYPLFLPPLGTTPEALQGAVAWSQGIVLFSLVLWLGGMSMHFLGRAATPWNQPSALVTHYWVAAVCVALVLQVAHSFCVAGGWSSGPPPGVWAVPFSPYLAPWDIWVAMLLWQLLAHALFTVTKAMDVARHAQNMKRLKLLFDTRLGQWSPR
jgi:hypothetical protein